MLEFFLGNTAARLGLYGLVAVVAGSLTWWTLSTIDRARQADVLEAQLAAAKQSAEAMSQFTAKVEGVRNDFAARFEEFSQQLDTIGAQRRERIIERLPANTRTCLDADTVRLLNTGDGDPARLPSPAGKPDDARAPVTRTAGSGLR